MTRARLKRSRFGNARLAPSHDGSAVDAHAIVSRSSPRCTGRAGKHVRILLSGPWYTVVGVAGDVRDTALDRPVDPIVYCPLLPPAADARWAPRDLAMVVRVAGDPAVAAPGIREAVRRLDATIPMYRTGRLGDLVRAASASRELVLLLVASASAIALLVGAFGLYGVMSFVVSLRVREIGIRLALGVRPARIAVLIVANGLRVAAAGVVAGTMGAIVLARVLSSALFDVAPGDTAVLAGSIVPRPRACSRGDVGAGPTRRTRRPRRRASRRMTLGRSLRVT